MNEEHEAQHCQWSASYYHTNT